MQNNSFFHLLRGNRNALAQLLDSETFDVVEVIDVNGPGNNSLITVEILRDGLDEDQLPIVIHTGILKRFRYEREELTNVITQILPSMNGTPVLELTEEPSVESVTEALLNAGLSVGDNAIEVTRIGQTNILMLSCTNKSIRFRGHARIRFI